MPSATKPHFGYIDCLRGYAVTMVILCHLTYQFPELPYPVHRETVMGWFGVQLFFLASCLTLLMSWHYEAERDGAADVGAFFLRRFFRIAPAYYMAGLLYFLLIPPPSGFDAWHAAASALFVNAWHPVLMPAVTGGWAVVPGGWSIGVEFTFYMVFPFFAVWTTTRTRALLVLGAAILVGLVVNLLAKADLDGIYQPSEISNFLFFWFPNEMSVFALGGVLYFLIADPAHRIRNLMAQHATLWATASLILFLLFAYIPVGHYLGDRPFIPVSLAICIPLAGFVLALSTGKTRFVNPIAAAMGKVSFSAYLLHFAVIQGVEAFPETFRRATPGVGAIVAFAATFVLVAIVTYILSWASYQAIEVPMQNVGKSLIRARQARSKALGQNV
ncbi:MAG TPA: acyltransferase [Aliidongia sp.]|nr:acyltransferase [Aliidongia sp.]